MKTRTMLAVLLGALILVSSLAGPSLAGRTTPGGDSLDTVLSKFTTEIKRAMVLGGVPGLAVAVVLDDEIVYLRGFGQRKLGGEEAVDPDTVFEIGSTSKAFTSALVATVVDQGTLSWSDHVIDHLPGFKLYDEERTRNFLVEQVMSQCSGLPAYALTYPPFWGYSREHTLSSLQYVEPVAELGTTFAYQNVFFLTAGELIQAASGLTWEQALEERIFTPLGMDRSSCTLARLLAQENRASFHATVNGKVVAAPDDLAVLPWSEIYGPAGGINSTARNMAAWLRMQLNQGLFEGRRIISQENLEYLHQPYTLVGDKDGVTSHYCQGWIHSGYSPHPIVWHNGDTNLAHSMVALVPEAGLGVAILSNLGQTTVPDSLAFYLYGLYFGDLGLVGRTTLGAGLDLDIRTPRAKVPASAQLEGDLDPTRYPGTYSNAVYEARVVQSGGRFSLVIGPNQVELPLTVVDRDTFTLSIPYFVEQAGAVKFTLDHNGEVRSMAVESFTDDGIQGVLTRVD